LLRRCNRRDNVRPRIHDRGRRSQPGEIQARSNLQHQIFALHLTVLGLIFGAWLTRSQVAFLFFVPIEAAAMGLWWFDHSFNIEGIGAYTASEIEAVINNDIAQRPFFLHWELGYRPHQRTSGGIAADNFLLAIVALYILPAVLAIVLLGTKQDEDGGLASLIGTTCRVSTTLTSAVSAEETGTRCAGAGTSVNELFWMADAFVCLLACGAFLGHWSGRRSGTRAAGSMAAASLLLLAASWPFADGPSATRYAAVRPSAITVALLFMMLLPTFVRHTYCRWTYMCAERGLRVDSAIVGRFVAGIYDFSRPDPIRQEVIQGMFRRLQATARVSGLGPLEDDAALADGWHDDFKLKVEPFQPTPQRSWFKRNLWMQSEQDGPPTAGEEWREVAGRRLRVMVMSRGTRLSYAATVRVAGGRVVERAGGASPSAGSPGSRS
jgi:hypothetical protein